MAEEKKVTKSDKAPKKSSVFSKKAEPKKTAPKKSAAIPSVGSSVVIPDGRVGKVIENVVRPSGNASLITLENGQLVRVLDENLKSSQ